MNPWDVEQYLGSWVRVHPLLNHPYPYPEINTPDPAITASFPPPLHDGLKKIIDEQVQQRFGGRQKHKKHLKRQKKARKQAKPTDLVGDLRQADAIAREVLVQVEPVQRRRRRLPHDRGEHRRGELRERPLELGGYQRERLVLDAEKGEGLDGLRDHLGVEAEEGVVEELGEVLRQALGFLCPDRIMRGFVPAGGAYVKEGRQAGEEGCCLEKYAWTTAVWTTAVPFRLCRN